MNNRFCSAIKLSVFFLLLASVHTKAFAAYERYQPPQDKLTALQVSGRGLGNLVGMPAELVSTAIREVDAHPKAWPVTYAPRVVTNLMARAFSGVYDFAFFPWVVPFADDTSSWTEGLGLPEYPWQTT